MLCKYPTLVFATWVVCVQTAPSSENATLLTHFKVRAKDELHNLQKNSLNSHELINLTIYYEALDQHSIDFFTNQLLDVFLRLRRQMLVRLVPYGRGKTVDGRGTVCEHGRDECSLNKVMACAIRMLHSDEDRVVYSTCVLSAGVGILKGPRKCAERVGLTWGRINNCATGLYGERLLRRMGRRTPVTVSSRKLPMIEINGIYDPDRQREMLHNLERFVCRWLDYPTGCEHRKLLDQQTTAVEETL